MPTADQKLTRIGVFYDGNFFLHVSNYYLYTHQRKSRLSISGIHEFIKKKVSELEGVDDRFCQIVDAHYFRGRLRAQDAHDRNVLLKERLFDDILIKEGITTHYLPVVATGEKGIDVWLALEAFELAIYKRFDVSVIVAGDGDFLPLIRKLNTIGTRVMLLGWDFKFTDKNGQERETRTAQAIIEEATYPILMHQVIDDRTHKNEAFINNLFLSPKETSVRAIIESAANTTEEDSMLTGRVQNLKGGFGFITPTVGGSNVFFFHSAICNADFNDLKVGDAVKYELGKNEKGECAVKVHLV